MPATQRSTDRSNERTSGAILVALAMLARHVVRCGKQPATKRARRHGVVAATPASGSTKKTRACRRRGPPLLESVNVCPGHARARPRGLDRSLSQSNPTICSGLCEVVAHCTAHERRRASKQTTTDRPWSCERWLEPDRLLAIFASSIALGDDDDGSNARQSRRSQRRLVCGIAAGTRARAWTPPWSFNGARSRRRFMHRSSALARRRLNSLHRSCDTA